MTKMALVATLAAGASSSPVFNKTMYGKGAFPDYVMKELQQQFGKFGLGDNHVACQKHVAGNSVKDAIDHASIMAPIRNQGSCGSCFIFSAIATLEAAVMVEWGQKVRLSEQQVIDCAASDFDELFGPGRQDWGGCGGGFSSIALTHFTEVGVSRHNPALCACSHSSYPYQSFFHEEGRFPVLQGCQIYKHCDCALPAGSVDTCVDVHSDGNHVAALKEALNDRPISIMISSEALLTEELSLNYTGGVVPAKQVKCGGGHTDHAVVAVGYGTDTDGTEYWKIRNSWGADWAEEGYVRVAIVDDDEGSLCLNTNEAVGVYPKLVPEISSEPLQV
jgi:cathepsin L